MRPCYLLHEYLARLPHEYLARMLNLLHEYLTYLLHEYLARLPRLAQLGRVRLVLLGRRTHGRQHGLLR